MTRCSVWTSPGVAGKPGYDLISHFPERQDLICKAQV